MLTYERIRVLCKEKGVTVSAAEKACGFSKGSLCKVGTNKPSSARIQTLASYLGVTVDYLLGNSEVQDSVLSQYLENPLMREFVLLAGGILPKENQERYLEGLIASLKSLRGIQQ